MIHAVHADAWYTKGTGHVQCQDYAVVAEHPGVSATAIVCDGCSGSADTDVGARLVAHAALTEGDFEAPDAAQRSIRRAWRAAAPLRVDRAALDTTLLVIHARRERIFVGMYGDGVLAATDREGAVHLWWLHQPQGAPEYLSYRLDAPRYAAYRRRFDAPTILRHYDPHTGWSHAARGRGLARLTLDPTRFALVAVGSDGLASFVARQHPAAPIAVETIAGHLLAVPRVDGRFAARRGRRFIAKDCARRGWSAVDDVAFAAVALVDPNTGVDHAGAS